MGSLKCLLNNKYHHMNLYTNQLIIGHVGILKFCLIMGTIANLKLLRGSIYNLLKVKTHGCVKKFKIIFKK
jgi:hypothetical protein